MLYRKSLLFNLIIGYGRMLWKHPNNLILRKPVKVIILCAETESMSITNKCSITSVNITVYHLLLLQYYY